MSNQTVELIKKWGYDRGITVNGTHYGQWLKLMSEFGELCDNLAKGKDIKDDIGDMFVVLVMMCEIDGLNIQKLLREVEPYYYGQTTDSTVLRGLSEELSKIFFEVNKDMVFSVLEWLETVALRNRTTLNECMVIAYNDIKDRKGYLNAEGVFIKEERQ